MDGFEVTFATTGTTRRYESQEGGLRLSDIGSAPELSSSSSSSDGDLFALKVNGLVMSLADALPARRATVAPVPFASPEGHSVLKRSLVFALMLAAERVHADAPFFLTVEHSTGPSSTGFMCVVDNGERQVTAADVARLAQAMDALVAEDRPIAIARLGYAEAVEYFRAHGKAFSAALVEGSNEFSVRCSACDRHFAIYRRPLVPRTGLLRGRYALAPHGVGFVLHFPPPTGGPVGTVAPDPVMLASYAEWNRWGKVLESSCVGEVNAKVFGHRAKDFIALCEAAHNEKIVQLSIRIQQAVAKGARLILIAGPSSSGKTTFACKLSLQLEILGIKPLTLSVDNYYKAHADVPRDASGAMDFEVLEALRVDRFNEDLLGLLDGKVVETPIFNFHTGKPRAETLKLQLPPGGVVICEGIHCLNNDLTPRVPAEKKFKIFLAPLSQVNLDESNFLSNSVTRLVRRIVRDYRARGYSALDTISRWPSVRRGEDTNIFPFMQNADAVFNTALDYEINVLKGFCKPLLKSVKPSTPLYNQAQELLVFLSQFFSVPPDNVPPTSLLREFIGGSFFGTS